MTPLPAGVALVLAPNAGPMTLDGTNTWVLAAADGAVVLDPGPDDEAHLDRVRTTAERLAGGVALVVLTHHHPDHAAGAPALAATTGAPVTAVDPALCLRAEPLVDGQRLPGGARVLLTPGHTADSACLDIEEAVLTGDTILGRGTTVVEAPGGELAAYLRSLERLAGLGPRTLLPGHGPVRADLTRVATELHDHRLARVAQVRAALEEGARTADEVVDRVYPGLEPALRPAALRSTEAAFAYLGLPAPT